MASIEIIAHSAKQSINLFASLRNGLPPWGEGQELRSSAHHHAMKPKDRTGEV
jgi:hypothetical protein